MTITTGTPLLTTKDVAAMLAVSEATLSRWRTRRTGPAFLMLGNIIRYSAEDVAAFVKEHRA